jgi:hypothetical protein
MIKMAAPYLSWLARGKRFRPFRVHIPLVVPQAGQHFRNSMERERLKQPQLTPASLLLVPAEKCQGPLPHRELLKQGSDLQRWEVRQPLKREAS